MVSQQRYLPFGGVSQTDFGYPGQRNLAAVGLMDYNARWYDSELGTFTQADVIVLDLFSSPGFNHYNYVYNNLFACIDPTGNRPIESNCVNTR